MRKSRFRLFFILTILGIVVLVFVKDLWLLGWIKGGFGRLWPGAGFSAQEIRVWPTSFTVRDFSLIHKDSSFNLSGPRASALFSFSPFFRQPLLYVKKADLLVDSVDSGPWQLRAFSLAAQRHSHWPFLQARMTLGSLRFQDKEFKNISASVWIGSHQLLIHEIRAQALGGDIRLKGSLQGDSFSAVIRFQGIDLKEVMDLVGGGKAVDATGVYSGEVILSWRDGNLLDLRGVLDSATGGRFIITDPALAREAISPGQNQNIVIENLKNYYYDIGKIELRNSGQDIKMDVVLQGGTGRRSLELTWHAKGQDDGS
ncbi:MAG: YdbH domain-containing protein [Candidatus Omnitrophota bacterium]